MKLFSCFKKKFLMNFILNLLDLEFEWEIYDFILNFQKLLIYLLIKGLNMKKIAYWYFKSYYISFLSI